jgi:hypothetical protein
MEEFVKNPYPLYSISFVILCMSFFGFSVAYTRMHIEWARITMCTLWALLLVFASMNQGFLYPSIVAKVLDIACGSSIMILYGIVYYHTMEWWHWISGIVTLLTFVITTVLFQKRMKVFQYVSFINVWHAWVILQIFLVPYTLPEGSLIWVYKSPMGC